MSNKNSELLEKTLSRPELHNTWVERYYSGRNNLFYDYAFDYIKKEIKLPNNAMFLDAGCGNGTHSLRLAKRGFRVTAADFSSEALKLCESNIAANGLKDKITTGKENLLSFSFSTDTFDGVLCWGVLMHIPEVEKALSELARVVKPGGYLVLCENSSASAENRMIGIIKKILRIRNTKDVKTNKGIECWTETEAGYFLIRITNMKWLINELDKHNLQLVSRRAGQFTELYVHLSSPFLRNIIQYFNELWFRFIKYPYPSLAQILIFRKNGN